MDFMRVISHIPQGRENRITREQLSQLTGRNGRLVQKAIEEARGRGVPVISSSHNKGYYIAETQAEIDTMLREIWSRIRSLLKTYWTLKRRLRVDGQMTLYELEELIKLKTEVFENAQQDN